MTQGLALLLSLTVEVPAAAIFVFRRGWGSRVRAAGAALIGTLATHWLAWWLALTFINSTDYTLVFLGIETAVVLAEAVVYRFLIPLTLARALSTSLVANGCSATLGLLLSALDWA